ncbi:hypothetical protein [Catalinimonas niigatensis]|uniref:hypothetical protein n=1 Tax=Catalinimonas niigatensis TaxID=1397264 RepID=UPI002665DB72|nr:hypothetical protein [Catalinimonas niigatensis]WPP52966.1 hypothetical protein PZB72_11325 [Catalinimonas niigatensis]
MATTENIYALDGWTTFQENESFSISYQKIHCNDRSNGVAFDFFAIRLENKSNQKLNLQWFNSPEEDEQYVSIILAPGEVMQGSCDSYAHNHLMVLIQAESGKAIAKPHFADFKFYRL